MLRSLNEIRNYEIESLDGGIGKSEDFLFDERDWTVRYLVVNTRKWLPGRSVLIPSSRVTAADWREKAITVALTKENIKASPPLSDDPPVSRELEIQLHQHYGWTPYWDLAPPPMLAGSPSLPLPAAEPAKVPEPSSTLRSVREVSGYAIHSIDDEDFGKTIDFLAEDTNWMIRLVAVKTGAWFGDKVIVSPEWIERIDWAASRLHLSLTREEVENSPPWSPEEPINRAYEVQLFDYYGRPYYW